jgi:hypothetical protein
MTGRSVTFPSEAVFQRTVLDLAKHLGLLVYHPHITIRDEAGFPDLVIVGTRGLLFRELKTEKGRVRPEQNEWIGRLARSGADVAVWRPSQWPHDIHAELKAIR